MIIEKLGLLKFFHVGAGQVFEFEGKIYMRVLQINVMNADGKYEAVCNAVDLIKGDKAVFEDDDKVTLYDKAKVTLI